MNNEIIYNKLLEIEKMLELSNDEILDSKEAAKFLKITQNSIYHLIHKRSIPCFKATKKLYFSKFSLMKWLYDHKLKTHEEIEREALDISINSRFSIRKVRK